MTATCSLPVFLIVRMRSPTPPSWNVFILRYKTDCRNRNCDEVYRVCVWTQSKDLIGWKRERVLIGRGVWNPTHWTNHRQATKLYRTQLPTVVRSHKNYNIMHDAETISLMWTGVWNRSLVVQFTIASASSPVIDFCFCSVMRRRLRYGSEVLIG